ncbi:MAG: FAD-dependent oxidoreductase [Acidobacteriaceae bacterium]|nr:FAD-dependent oxidoreductase [Acidobacteriaceae bacterium]
MLEKGNKMPDADVVICGAGIMGLSLAVELQSRGAHVCVVEKAEAGSRTLGQASWAAAGMLAADDPHNPEVLHKLSRWSRELYDGYLDRLRSLSAQTIPYQTNKTLQFLADGTTMNLVEQSVNPRDVMRGLESAVEALQIPVRRGFAVAEVVQEPAGLRVVSEDGESVQGAQVVHAMGAWSALACNAKPRKGQMMRVRLESDTVVREAGVYIAPRQFGEQAGTALIGATVEDAGFDTSVQEESLEWLREYAARLLPEIREAELVETWVGFRPAVPGELPVIGKLEQEERQWVACGHFRNGILLAPATACAIADLLEEKRPPVDLALFAPHGSSLAQGGR